MRICARCDRTIRSQWYETITVDSASVVRPDQYAHEVTDPKCRPITERDPADLH